MIANLGYWPYFFRLDIKLLLAMQNAWEFHCLEGEFKDPQGKLFKIKFFGKEHKLGLLLLFF